jgi:predicted DNA-binding transcriptional regulator AlpA
MDTTNNSLVRIPEARRLLGGISHTVIYQLINRNEIRRVKIGARSFVTRSSIDAYIDRLEAVETDTRSTRNCTGKRDQNVFAEAIAGGAQ